MVSLTHGLMTRIMTWRKTVSHNTFNAALNSTIPSVLATVMWTETGGWMHSMQNNIMVHYKGATYNAPTIRGTSGVVGDIECPWQGIV